MSASGGDARATVVAGMELIRWTCDRPLWRRWCASRDAAVGPASIGPLLAAGGITGAVGFAALVPYPPAQLIAAALGLGLAGLGVVDWRLKPRNALPPTQLDKEVPPELVITTTGLLCGDVALCWEAHHQRLIYAGIGGTTPLYLLFRFRVGRVFRRRLVEARLPVPPELEQDGAEAARSIRRRLHPSDGAHLFRLETRRRQSATRDRLIDGD